MEYQKIISVLHNTPSQPSRFKAENWFEINDDPRGVYNTNSQIKFKTLMLRSSTYDYSDILVKGTIPVPKTASASQITETKK